MDTLHSEMSASHPIFGNLHKELAHEFNDKRHIRFYKKKQALYYVGNPVIGVYFIQSGRGKVYKTGPEGKQYILRLANPQDVLGLESIFNPIPYFSSTAEMVEEGWVHLIEKQTILKLLAKDYTLALNLMTSLAAQIVSGDDERVDLAQRAVRERMARLLVTLSQNYGTKIKTGIRLSLKLSREDIAEMIGTAAESAIRLLSEFREEKIIGVEGKDIIILDEARLVRVANLNI